MDGRLGEAVKSLKEAQGETNRKLTELADSMSRLVQAEVKRERESFRLRSEVTRLQGEATEEKEFRVRAEREAERWKAEVALTEREKSKNDRRGWLRGTWA